ncbi:hypothetical protein EVJ50_14130 [Synechococcus sp. RSCCF101]|uniref:hypothetical protein n=1 Tax=Synechococcus sp. RSCCF101 TaxID=2511069 RepID=UPI001247ACAC|nr:hypothetical protein [Synechococcus sp. RSCCF101]QEY33202.1 hypothetical protein EVJ50_14130 [Synechococcus sp. RSCCF101]
MAGHRRCLTGTSDGFTLAELLIASALGMALAAAFLQLLLVESGASRRLLSAMHERQWLERTRDLIHHDRAQAQSEARDPQVAVPACRLSGRRPVLHLHTRQGPITYSLGNRPSRIWQQPVLMRCGPSYGLDGSLQPGQALNRVIADGSTAERLGREGL